METTSIDLSKDLKEQYVAFIDVLGFSELVFKKNYEKLNAYLKTISAFLHYYEKENKTIQCLSISDSIILVTPASNEENFKLLLETIQEIQGGLATLDIWCRGAVSVGQVYFDAERSILVGEGFIRAYTLEKDAIYPCVTIDPRIILEVSESGKHFKHKYNNEINLDFSIPGIIKQKLIYTDPPNEPLRTWKTGHRPKYLSDDAFFICYGNYIVRNTQYDTLIGMIDNIKRNLYAKQETYVKYYWLKEYFTEIFARASVECFNKKMEFENLLNRVKEI